jgi:3-isopropylmalate/(R)-2-methylmalate dehydratase small subunit
VTRPDGEVIKFEMDPFRKHCLVNGLDEVGLTMAKGKAIDSFEAKQKQSQPWIGNAAR